VAPYIFDLSSYPLTAILEQLEKSDFAIFVFNAGDVTQLSGVGSVEFSVRDNVVLEFGAAAASLGPQKCLVVRPRGVPLRIASDLAGFSLGDFDPAAFEKVGSAPWTCSSTGARCAEARAVPP